MDLWATPVTDVGEMLLRRTAQQDSPNATLGYKRYQKSIKRYKKYQTCPWSLQVEMLQWVTVRVHVFQGRYCISRCTRPPQPECNARILSHQTKTAVWQTRSNYCLDASDAYLSMKVSSKMGRYLKGFTQRVISSILEYLSGKSWTRRGPSSTR